MLNMLYDEYMGMVQYDQQFLNDNPLAPMRQWDMESHGGFSREKERMRLFAKLRIAEHIPGMDWKAMCALTPEQTEWVMEIVREEAAAKSKAEGDALRSLQNSTAAMHNLNLSDTAKK